MSNAPAGNEVLVFTRGGDGNLTSAGSYPTGGKGGPFPNAGSLVFDSALSAFFAVNAGDSTISMLKLNDDGTLSLVANVPSGGSTPASVTVYGTTLYVANQGSSKAAANITGFTISSTGLTALANSTQAFSTPNPTPAQIGFSPDGKVLVVTEKTGNNIDTFAITGGVAGPVQSVAVPDVSLGDAGTTTGEPFGFVFGNGGTLIVTEARNGMGASAIASFTVADTGVLTPVTDLSDPQQGSCWITAAGAFAWSVNTASGSITSIGVDSSGNLSLVNATTGLNGTIGVKATDIAISPDGGYLYAIASNTGQIAIFDVYADGSIVAQPFLSNLPNTLAGIVAR